MQVNINNTFQPNLNKASNETQSNLEATGIVNMTITPLLAGNQSSMLNLDTYKRVYKCNVDNLLKKYALASQLGYDDDKAQQIKN